MAENETGSVIIGGEIIKFDRKLTKGGSPFATAIIAYGMNEWRVRFWKESLAMYGDLLVEGQTIMVTGKTDSWKGSVSVVCEHAATIEKFAKEMETNAS